MKYRLFIISLVAALASIMPGSRANAENRGVPFIRNFSAKEYNAHNRNFDVACDLYGSVYFANFECILYYDGTTWRKLYSPGISRITRIVRDKWRNKIWFGGFNLFGYLTADKLGRLEMKPLVSDAKNGDIGEVDMIKVLQNTVYVHTVNGRTYQVDGNRRLVPFRGDASFIELSMRNVALQYTGSINVSMMEGGGLLVSNGQRRRTITEADGLCTNNINFTMFDLFHTVWGATDKGVFAVEIPSPYSYLNEAQGLKGEVYAINEIGNTIYAGTLQGLYRIDDGKVTRIKGIHNACWDLKHEGDGVLLASTMDGLFRVTQSGASPITSASTMSVCKAPQGGYYTSELDGLYYVGNGAQHTKIAPIEKGQKMRIVGAKLRIETINGQLWDVDLNGKHTAKLIRAMEDVTEPMIDYTDGFGRRWLTDPEGKDLAVITKTEDKVLKEWIHPIGSRTLNAVFCSRENSLWVGGDFGMVNCDIALIKTMKNPTVVEPVYIRQIRIMGDSVIWGGYSSNTLKPLTNIKGIHLTSDIHKLSVYFSARENSIFEPTQYRFRVNNGRWSDWSTETNAEFNNMSHGRTVFEVEALDILGNISPISRVEWYVDYPFYLKWYAFAFYVIALAVIVYTFMHYREKKLEEDKAHLEREVSRRTEEVRRQKDELELANDELKRTQADLVRMERTATAGKLTRGLIDRILNPINYINNFSKLTSGLAKDLGEDIEEEKDNISKENYEDCQDVLDMMQQNLSKIEEHGVNTSRTLRAMEAMLNCHVGAKKSVDMALLCRQTCEVAKEYYKKEIEQYHISFTSQVPEGVVEKEIDPESLNNVLKSIMSNAIYAVIKKYQHAPYDAQVELRMTQLENNGIQLVVHDNGIGIEEGIKEKVFDPFFTTKTTGEASGVGLYLAREIVQDHKGTITLESVKDSYTNVIITL